jgi:hypothetical protein
MGFRARSYAALDSAVREMVVLMGLRFVAACLFAVFFAGFIVCGGQAMLSSPYHCYKHIVSGGVDFDTALSVENLRWLLCAFHICAATGVDEQWVFNALAYQTFLGRLLTPGSVVSPLFACLPRSQSVAGSTLYASFLFVGAWCLSFGSTSGEEAFIVTVLFVMACVCDVGLFISTRPADIFKFWLALLLFDDGIQACFMLVALLYFWSGVSKCRPYFFDSVFPYQFLMPNPFMYWLRNWYVDVNNCSVSLMCKLFGLCGAVGEALIGIGLMIGPFIHPFCRLGCTLAATCMHVFIYLCGIGPYRWNVLQVYLLWSTYYASSHNTYHALNFFTFLYIVLVGVMIPVIGCASPHLLGRYFGGYRGATFHFAGNEMVHGCFVRRCLLLADEVTTRSSDHTHGYVRRALKTKRLAEASNALADDPEFLRFPFLADNFNVDSIARKHVWKASKCTSFSDFNSEYVFFTLSWLNMNGPLLNTKWDESVKPITDRMLELIDECFTDRISSDIVVLRVHPISLLATQKRWDLWPLSGAKTTSGKVAAPMF